MLATPRRLAVLTKPLRSWGPALVLSAVVVVSAVVVAVGLRTSPVSPARPILVSSGTWAPFVGPELPNGGPLTALVTETLKRAGYTPQISYSSWTLAQRQVTSGAAQGVYPLVSSASRRDQFLISDRLIDFEYVLFYNRARGEPRISSAADLSRLRVGSVAGYEYWPELESAVHGGFVEFDTAAEGFRALADGKIDVLAEGLLSGQAAVAAPSFPGDSADFGYLRDGRLVRSVEGLYFMMPKTSQTAAVMREFNKALAAMRQSQEYKAIVAELEPGGSQEVTLDPVGKSGLVELLDDAGRTVLYSPRGTRARVLTWPDKLAGRDGAKPGRILVKVKVTNGPAQGRALNVDARALHLEVTGS
ncbi:MAG: substrate-binding periplasmic protein [Spirillospora sp.]